MACSSSFTSQCFATSCEKHGIPAGRKTSRKKRSYDSSGTSARTALQPDPEKLMLQRERLDRLHIAVLNLTPLQRECLHLRAEGLRYREVANLLKISPSTVMDAVRRATLKLA